MGKNKLVAGDDGARGSSGRPASLAGPAAPAECLASQTLQQILLPKLRLGETPSATSARVQRAGALPAARAGRINPVKGLVVLVAPTSVAPQLWLPAVDGRGRVPERRTRVDAGRGSAGVGSRGMERVDAVRDGGDRPLAGTVQLYGRTF